jgi:hypothetical protein
MSRIVYIAFALLIAAISNTHALEVGEPIEDVGHILDLPDGGKLQLQVKEKKILAYFADADGNVIESPADGILMVVDDSGHRNDEIRILLKPSEDDPSLSSNRALHPPYVFRARLIIRFTNKNPKTFPDVRLKLDRNIE